ncbi:hypothetical protein CR513_27924, partial [Mucuna pruriens]
MNVSSMQFQQNLNARVQDLKIQVGQLATSVSQLQSAGFGNIPSQTIPNPKGGVSAVTWQSGRELPQHQSQDQLMPSLNQKSTPKSNKLESSHYPFPPRQFRQRNMRLMNIPLLDAIKQIPKYAKFLKELCMHKRKKLKRGVEMGGVMSALIKNEEVTIGSQQALPEKCRDPKIFFVPYTIGDCTFVDAMLDLGTSINVMSSSIYKSLNFGDLEPVGMIIQLANRSVVQLLGILEDVLVQVNELIFLPTFMCWIWRTKHLGKDPP